MLLVNVCGLKASRHALRSLAMADLGFTELLPSPVVELGDNVLEAHARSHAKTVYHPSGTCKMGRDPPAVVDTQFRVHGRQCQRVADASTMPTVVSGNTNAPCLVIDERCADSILCGAAGAA
ncbi:GMC oxidoreductase [Azohydromonas australica]|uniref:GMC oxidoreductase n=1 Tax=Azohydromonas australica TaxID=364039 RepID=UPI000490D200|nr:GMC oxidoreductase [Azohydromonas australica]